MTASLLVAPDLAGRAAAFASSTTGPPSGKARAQQFATSLRAKKEDRNGKSFYRLDGEASVVDNPYEMWDMYGPYTETIRSGAFDVTLGKSPEVVFLVNHGGLAMARTTADTLELAATPHLTSTAWLNPTRQDVTDLVAAVDDGAITEMSFAFYIVRGMWSPDWTEYYIDEVDIDRGDVSAVNYGANPYTSISARARQMFEAIDHLDGPALRAAQARLSARLAGDVVAPAGGADVAFLRAQLAAGHI